MEHILVSLMMISRNGSEIVDVKKTNKNIENILNHYLFIETIISWDT